jgi:hypothetical protein
MAPDGVAEHCGHIGSDELRLAALIKSTSDAVAIEAGIGHRLAE